MRSHACTTQTQHTHTPTHFHLRKPEIKPNHFRCGQFFDSTQIGICSVLSSPETIVVPAARPPPPEIPKSPPKWPLRPGVLVHVKCDTKQNLCASRIQSPNTTSSTTANLNLTNVSYASPLITLSSKNASVAGSVGAAPTPNATPVKLPELPARNATPPIIVSVAPKPATAKAATAEVATVRPTCTPPSKTATVKRMQAVSVPNAEVDAIGAAIGAPSLGGDTTCQNNGAGDSDNYDAETTRMVNAPMSVGNTNSNANNNDELMHFTTSSLIERIMGRLRWRREHSKHSNQNNSNGNSSSKKSIGAGIASLLPPFTFTSNATAAQNSQQLSTAAQTNGNSGGASENEESIFSRSNKRAVNLLRATGWFGSGKSTNSSTGLMYDKRHHLTGITCSDGGKYDL